MRPFLRHTTTAIIALFLSGNFLLGQTKIPGYDLSEIIEKKLNHDQVRSGNNAHDYYLVELSDRYKKNNLLAGKMIILKDLGDGFLIVDISKSDLLQLSAFDNVWQINDRWKLQRGLIQKVIPNKSVFVVKTRRVNQTLEALVKSPPIIISNVTDNYIRLVSDYNSIIDHVINLSEVTYVGQELLQPTTEARVADMNLNPNQINKLHHFMPALNGQGMTVSIQEPAYDKEDIDLQGRDIPSDLSSDDVDTHATQMATIVAGAGNSFVTGKGVAWGANITSSDFADIVPDSDEDYKALNVNIQNHSYGTAPENFYGSFAEAYDISANNNENLLHIFSAGNRGQVTTTEGPYQGVNGFANLTGNFKMAKNILTLGSIDTAGQVLPFSSRGPAYDGRVKPELVAYASVGTSNSSALVSGIGLLMQQAYFETNGTIPASALVKAVLINSATDVGPEHVDFWSGYGNVDGYRSVRNIADGNYLEGNVAQGQQQTFQLTLPANVDNLKVTLVWNDPAAQIDNSLALVNDLDLTVESNGEVLLPWILNAAPDSTSLSELAQRGEDHLNNIEQVTVKDPVEGEISISVTGFDISTDNQDFYLAYQWDLKDQFEWNYPTGSDNMPFNGESVSYFRWNSTLTQESGRLEYSLDNGTTWALIDDQVDLSNGSLRWDAPKEIFSKAIARMTVEGNEYVTEEFTISRPERVGIGFNCADSLLLQWNRLEGVSDYAVSVFQDNAIQTFITTSDTSLVLQKSDLASNLVSVRPILNDGTPLIESGTFDYSVQGVQCYISFFFPEVVPDDGIYLNLKLGTVYAVDKVIFERKVGEEFIPIGERFISNTDSTNIVFLDTEPKQGFNINRARVVLSNGQEVITERSEIFFLTELPFIITPNPVIRSNGINIISKRFEQDDLVVLRLFDTMGRLVLERQLFSEVENVTLEKVNTGMYIYNIDAPGINFRGRIMIE